MEKADALFAKETDADITKPYWGEKNEQLLAFTMQRERQRVIDYQPYSLLA